MPQLTHNKIMRDTVLRGNTDRIMRIGRTNQDSKGKIDKSKIIIMH